MAWLRLSLTEPSLTHVCCHSPEQPRPAIQIVTLMATIAIVTVLRSARVVPDRAANVVPRNMSGGRTCRFDTVLSDLDEAAKART